MFIHENDYRKNEQKLNYLYSIYRYHLYLAMEPDIGFLDSHKIEAYWEKVTIMLVRAELVGLVIMYAFIWHLHEEHFLCFASFNPRNIYSTAAC